MNDLFSNESNQTAYREVITYTAADVHAEITAKAIMLMEILKKEIGEARLPDTVKHEKSLLSRLGFTASKNMQAISSVESRVNQINETRKLNNERLKLIQLLHKYYGTNCMLMSLNDFMALLDKYNLSCGFLEDYKGSIPDENLNEVLKAKEFTSPNWTNIFKPGVNWIQKRLVPYYRVKWTMKYQFSDKFKRFPLILRQIDSLDMRTSRENSTLLIAAPAQEMDTSVEVVNVRTEGPIVFSVTKQDIIIWSAWGDEGDDEVMKKYKALNDFLDSHTIN